MNIPTIIYLQHDPGGDTTWCDDKINDDDIEYIIIDEYNNVVAENLRLRNELEQWRMVAITNGDRYGR